MADIQGERLIPNFDAWLACANMNIPPESLMPQKILEDPRAHSTLILHQEKSLQDHWCDGRSFCGISYDWRDTCGRRARPPGRDCQALTTAIQRLLRVSWWLA
jgi:hypothetical protein